MIRGIHRCLMSLAATSTAVALFCVALWGTCGVCVQRTSTTTDLARIAFDEWHSAPEPVGLLPENHTQICTELTQTRASLSVPLADRAVEQGRLTLCQRATLPHSPFGPSVQILFCTWLA